jgi:hypothetical protein
MLAGSILLRPLRYFIALEQTKGRWIGDAMEGSVMADLKGSHDGKAVMEMTPLGHNPIISVAPGLSNVTITDCVLHYTTPTSLYVWCVSAGQLPDLRKAMCVKSGQNPNPYNACVQIIDFGAFTAHVIRNGTIGALIADKAFSRATIRPVEYGEIRKTTSRERLPTPGPFLKDKDFAFQREYRMVLEPRGDMGDAVVVHFPDAQRFLRRVDL